MNYVHNLDPFAIHFTGDIGIRWYGLAYLTGFFLGYVLISYLAKRKKINLPVEKVGDFVTAVAIGTMVGGRLGYALFYKPQLFVEWGSPFHFGLFLKFIRGEWPAMVVLLESLLLAISLPKETKSLCLSSLI